MIAAFEAECVKEAQVRGVTLPSDWSVRGLLEELREAMMDVQPAVLKAAAGLRHRGLLTAVLANHWLDDSAAGDGPARLLSLLGGHFDQVLQSCRSGHRVPESSAFSSALRHLGVTSQQALWLDADEEGVKAAEGAGMKAVLVENLADALDKLADFTGVQGTLEEVSCSGYLLKIPTLDHPAAISANMKEDSDNEEQNNKHVILSPKLVFIYILYIVSTLNGEIAANTIAYSILLCACVCVCRLVGTYTG
ncbi:bifunctional epoxide hydrolase 2-like isoform X2 [Micropterus dolomieu]|nr:bifunctional epoxide hydrolase 2-like isoform X2 [Micropterus dolomieu]XP_045897484.1 bifunctional epoxide hydrolase 2-like isoform X2 [Micropterus dolomieu]